MRHLPQYLFIVFLIIATTVFGQEENQFKLARIKDKDGYIFVRQYAGKKYEVIDTLKTGELFECQPMDYGEGYYSIWAFTHNQKYNEFGGVISPLYIHKSRVEFIDSLSDSAQEKVYFGVLENYRKACIDYRNNKYTTEREKRLGHFAYPYMEIMPFFCKFLKRTNDTVLYKEFMYASSYDDGGIGETSSGYIAQCFVNNEALFVRELKKMKKNNRERVMANVDFGLGDIFGSDSKKVKLYSNRLHEAMR